MEVFGLAWTPHLRPKRTVDPRVGLHLQIPVGVHATLTVDRVTVPSIEGWIACMCFQLEFLLVVLASIGSLPRSEGLVMFSSVLHSVHSGHNALEQIVQLGHGAVELETVLCVMLLSMFALFSPALTVAFYVAFNVTVTVIAIGIAVVEIGEKLMVESELFFDLLIEMPFVLSQDLEEPSLGDPHCVLVVRVGPVELEQLLVQLH
mmetsp:Transcript_115089/g.247348  ORF Transcript_115089/g.247348 Transcript_115089/m.247348 type:complete len:205 (+) Transcript_115089:340-954(+)